MLHRSITASLLDAANPRSLCVEFLTAARGTMSRRDGGRERVLRRKGAVETTPLNGYVGYALRRAQGVIFADFIHTLAELDLRPGQFAVLILIDQNPGTSQSSISSALGIQKANFVATIAELEDRGLVRRRKSESDGRTYSLGLTAKGRSVLRHAAELQSVHEARVVEQIGSEGRLQLLSLLERLARLPFPSPLE
jgi:DNA-binding MarR family transcriptional regulator